MSSLAVHRIGAENATRHLVMLHGIYGRGRNWGSIARAITSARPQYACWLVDLPHHGDSGSGTHGDTVIGLAGDVSDWTMGEPIVPAAVLGHSFGGKVALAFADRAREQALQVWVIDSTPEVREPSGSAWTMLEVVRRLPPRFATREEAIAAIAGAGYSTAVAQWMASNLIRTENGFTWRLEFEVMERLVRDFFRTDLWRVVEQPAPGHDLHFVKASRSSAISPGALARLESAGARVHVHHVEGGHWIHTEAPDVISALVVDRLPK